MTDFKDQVVLVTGGAGYLGRAVTRAFLASGAKVTCVDKARDRLQELFPDGPDESGQHYAVSIDVTNPDSVARVVTETIHQFGRLGILVNTVGGFRSGTPVHQTPLETWDFMMNLNARTAYIVSQAVLPSMLEQGSGVILHTAARPGLSGRANMAAYSASKSAVIRLTESLSAEYKDLGIRVNCVIPGTLDTPQNRADMPDADTNRWVKPESLAKVIMFLASEGARDIHGAAIPVYGRT